MALQTGVSSSKVLILVGAGNSPRPFRFRTFHRDHRPFDRTCDLVAGLIWFGIRVEVSKCVSLGWFTAPTRWFWLLLSLALWIESLICGYDFDCSYYWWVDEAYLVDMKIVLLSSIVEIFRSEFRQWALFATKCFGFVGSRIEFLSLVSRLTDYAVPMIFGPLSPFAVQQVWLVRLFSIADDLRSSFHSFRKFWRAWMRPMSRPTSLTALFLQLRYCAAICYP